MPNYKDIEVNGKAIRINRLSVDAESQIWFDELAPRIAPLIGDLLNGVKSLVTARAGTSPVLAVDFGELLRQIVRELPWAKVQPLAQRLLATSQHDGRLLWEQRNAVLVSTWDLCTVLYAALELFYSDFWQALGSAPSLVASLLAGMKRGSEGSTATDTSTSSPSTTS